MQRQCCANDSDTESTEDPESDDCETATVQAERQVLISYSPECAGTLPEFTGLRQLVVAPYRIIYEATASACDILGVMRCSRLRLDIRGKQEIT